MKPNVSAIGTASQTPISSNKIGRKRIAPTMKIKVLEKEIMADVFPSEKAVNIEEAKIPNPMMIKAKE